MFGVGVLLEEKKCHLKHLFILCSLKYKGCGGGGGGVNEHTWTTASNGTSSLQGEHLCKIILKSMHKCTSYGPDKLNLWPFYHLTFMRDLHLQPTNTNVSNGTSPSQGEHLCKIMLKSMHICWSDGPDKLNLWPFYYLIFKCDLDLQPTQTNVSHGKPTPQGEHLCKIIFKSMHKCRSYGPDKLIYVTFKCDLGLQPT